jgi:hypothetical protein
MAHASFWADILQKRTNWSQDRQDAVRNVLSTIKPHGRRSETGREFAESVNALKAFMEGKESHSDWFTPAVGPHKWPKPVRKVDADAFRIMSDYAQEQQPYHKSRTWKILLDIGINFDNPDGGRSWPLKIPTQYAIGCDPLAFSTVAWKARAMQEQEDGMPVYSVTPVTWILDSSVPHRHQMALPQNADRLEPDAKVSPVSAEHSKAAGSTAADSTAADSTAADSTAAGSVTTKPKTARSKTNESNTTPLPLGDIKLEPNRNESTPAELRRLQRDEYLQAHQDAARCRFENTELRVENSELRVENSELRDKLARVQKNHHEQRLEDLTTWNQSLEAKDREIARLKKELRDRETARLEKEEQTKSVDLKNELTIHNLRAELGRTKQELLEQPGRLAELRDQLRLYQADRDQKDPNAGAMMESKKFLKRKAEKPARQDEKLPRKLPTAGINFKVEDRSSDSDEHHTKKDLLPANPTNLAADSIIID